MQFTQEQKDTLAKILTQKIGDEYTVFQSVLSLIPYEIRNPEDASAMNRVISQLDPDNVADFDPGRNSKITTAQYRQLFNMLNALESISANGFSLSPRSEIIFEKNLEEAHDILLEIIKGLGQEELNGRCDNLKTAAVKRGAKLILQAFTKRGDSDAGTELRLEDEERELGVANKTLMQEALGSINASLKMIDAIDMTLEMMRQHRKEMGYGS